MNRHSGGRFFVNEVSEAAAVPAPRRGAVLLFGHVVFGYGHIARCHKIARRLVEQYPLDAYVVSSRPEYEPAEPHEAIHEVLLPTFRIASPDFLPDGLPIPERASMLPHVPTDQLSPHRGRLLQVLTARIRPRAVLLEGFPFLRPTQALEECGPMLDDLRAHSPETLRCAGFNGVSTGLYAQGQAARFEQVLSEYVDRLFVYVNPGERARLLDASPWLRAIEAKVHVVGHVFGSIPQKADPSDEILATFGSGVDAFRKIVLVVEAFFAFAASRPGFTLEVVTGGQLPDKGYREIACRIGGRPDVRLSRVVPGLGRRLNHYRLVLSMGGYNACGELYLSSTRNIILPRYAPDFAEQMEQARKFLQAGGIDHIVDADATSPAALAGLMARTLAAPPATRLPLDTGGAEAAARILATDRERRRSEPDR
jgi:predicted glycosyltransferase